VRSSWGPTFESYVRDNVFATQRLFEGAAAQGIRVVYASSSSVYGDAAGYPLREDTRLAPVSPYGMTKLAGEVLASTYGRSRGLDAVGLRYFSVYGPRQRPDMAFALMLRCLVEDRPFPLLGTGRQTREFTYVGDVVEATLAAMRRAPAGRVYNVGGASEVSLLAAMALCERIAGRRLEVQHITPIAGEARRTSADVRRAAAELDWRPTTSLATGLQAQVEELEGVPAAASAA
jgi:UDP-glucuronate 4-epimerase